MTTLDPSKETDKVKGVYYSHSNRKEIYYEISLFSIDYIFAICGGLFQLLHFIFNFICEIYNDYDLDKEIIKMFSLDYVKVNTYRKSKLLKNNNKSITNIDREDIISNRSNIKFIKLKKESLKMNDNNFILRIMDKFNNSLDYKVFYDLLNEFKIIKKIILNINNYEMFDLLSKYEKFNEKSELVIDEISLMSDEVNKKLKKLNLIY